MSETLTYYAFPDIHWQKIRTDNPLERIMKENSSTHPCRGHLPRWPVLPQPSGRAAALHRRHGMVSQVLHEHAASLSAASHANRSRRLTKCAKDSGHYPPTSSNAAIRPIALNRKNALFASHDQGAETGLHRNWLHGRRQIPLSFHILVFKQLNCVRDH